jgi:uncharacterized protein YhdP
MPEFIGKGMNKNRIRKLAVSLAIILLLLATSFVVLIKMINLDTYKEQILSELQSTLKRPVSYRSGALSFSLGPAISLHGISIREPDNSGNFVTIENLTFRLDLLPLFKKQIFVHGLVADKAVINLERRSDGSFNITDLLQSSSKDTAMKIHQLKLKNADITFTDSFIQSNAVVTKLNNTDLFLENISRGSKGSFRLSTRLGGGASGTFSINGKIRLSQKDFLLWDSVIDAKVTSKKLESAHFWPYYQRYVPFKKITGAVDADSEIHGRLNEFTTSGKLSVHSLRFDYQPIFKQVINAKTIQIKYSMDLNKKDILVKAAEVDIDGADVKGSCAIRDYRSSDPRITAQAVTSRLDFARYKQYVPYGIIYKDTSEWIEQHITGGIYQLDEGRLDGRVSQILHMETGENYNILYIKARAEKGIVSYGSSTPAFNNIKGTLEMKGKDFLLHGMSGNFGTSPMTLEGRITDYPLDKPSGYPFKMVISPAKSELAWLLGKERSKQLSYNGSSSLTLTGEGFTSGYNLSGEWNLTPAAYSYSNFLAKPAGSPSHMKFKGSISPKEALLTSLNYTLGGLNLSLSAKYPFGSSKDLDLLINTNQFNIENIAQMSPYLTRYQPSGRIQLSLRGNLASSAQNFSWQGTVALNNASVRYSQSEKPVSGLTGSISFDETAMESSHLTARIGNTAFAGKGAISSLKPFAFSTSFSSPHIDPADFGFNVTQKTPQITKIKGDITFKENSLTIKALSGNLNSSQLSISGNISDLERMNADLSISSSQLDLSDLILLEGIEKVEPKTSRTAANPQLKAVIKADKGRLRDFEFRKLSTTINLANKVLLVQPLTADVLGGRLYANGQIDSRTAPARYQVEFKLANASANEIVDYISAHKKEMTGAISLEGSLTASGEIYDAIRKSAAGSIKVHAEQGTLSHFSGLSKVFSILNVSQLFKFRLPDMVSEGMPYSSIKGTFIIKDGIVSTSDLYLASNAMNMSLVGKHDFINDNMDMTLGIQPLQTIDKVVSHIPIVGWILTGKEKTLISTYFEIKGKSASPQVAAIPVKSLGKGVLGIFKRVFQLPAKLVTDTGEVILGN